MGKQLYKVIAKLPNNKQVAQTIRICARDQKEVRRKLMNYTIRSIQPIKGRNNV